MPCACGHAPGNYASSFRRQTYNQLSLKENSSELAIPGHNRRRIPDGLNDNKVPWNRSIHVRKRTLLPFSTTLVPRQLPARTTAAVRAYRISSSMAATATADGINERGYGSPRPVHIKSKINEILIHLTEKTL